MNSSTLAQAPRASIRVAFFWYFLLASFGGSAIAQDTGFHVDQDGMLLDAVGNTFLIRGINLQLGDFDNYNRNWYGRDRGIPDAMSPTGYFAADSIPYVRRQGFNAVRLLWRMNRDLPRLKTAIEACIAQQMVPIIELHDGTCSDDLQLLTGMAAYWANFWGNQLTPAERTRYAHCLIVNIANEWGSWNMDLDGNGRHDADDRAEWAMSYNSAVAAIRAASYDGLLMIDAPGCGQRPEAVLEQGRSILSADPQHNVMFGLHIYEDFQEHYDLQTVLDQLQNAHIPIHIGEFGPRATTDAVAVMRVATLKSIGYIGWSWQGDGSSGCCNDVLNVVAMVDDIPGTGDNERCECFVDFRDWQGNVLTDWGGILIEHPDYGVRATAKPCTVFQAITFYTY